jgi:hypothetical protein
MVLFIQQSKNVFFIHILDEISTRISHQPGFLQVQGARFEAVSVYCETLATK